jgi:hypothetical protein
MQRSESVRKVGKFMWQGPSGRKNDRVVCPEIAGSHSKLHMLTTFRYFKEPTGRTESFPIYP